MLIIGLICSVVFTIYLLWRIPWRSRLIGFICLSFLVLYLIHWSSDWYIVRGSDRVQAFSTSSLVFGSNTTVEWLDNPVRLLVVPIPLIPGLGVDPKQPKLTKLVVADLETRRATWESASAVNLKAAKSVFDPIAQINEHKNMAVLAALPKSEGSVAELSCFCFSVSLPGYNLAIPFGDSGWVTGTNYFGFVRLAVRELKSGPVVVELNQMLFNESFMPSLDDLARWIPGGKFLIFSANSYGDERVLALGPFNTSQNTHTNNKSKE